ncbi:hypothetical protein BD847_2328 [Flavobacterium cutihirudinis]|uniref:Uncharacterized protein n=1 Tax=Flavobacterium cutihirudinis TaxID=1265740 RepID=A0A3D9FS53_9FLAO|nr:DUF5695 domain-containing protein [Flavobacterium cutihirudinis]RED23280.1 hypothetical protein BD847_2328 [Flavobacterium cutihirudinis]
MKNIKLLALVFCCAMASNNLQSQEYWDKIKAKKSTLEVEKGVTVLNTKSFELKLLKSSQTVAALSPLSDKTFDFTPGERLSIRDKDGLYQLGDINLRIKAADGSWKSYSTATKRATVTALDVSGNTLAAADLSNTLPADIPVTIKRFYEQKDGNLILRFEITNKSNAVQEIGALGVPMVFNNILEGKTLDETHLHNVFFDPYIGKDAGYLEVKRLSGHGPALLLLPETNMPFEAYRPLLDDETPRSIVFEGFHEWMPFSKAYAEQEWKSAEQWNTPTSLTLKSGETKSFALKFVLVDQIENIQSSLIKNERPVAVGVPGYVLPLDVNGQLFLKYKKAVKSLKIEPEDALTVEEKSKNKNGYFQYVVHGKKWGRARLTVTYEDGLEQTINYKVIKSETNTVNDFGHFSTTAQWFDKKDDPFHRNPSVISYDYETKKQVSQDSRVWIAGLSDEGGAGGWLGAIMKELIAPKKEEIEKLEKFIDNTLWGGIQYNTADTLKYGVKKSVFYYEPTKMPEGTYSKDINYKTWAAWDKKGADDPGRSYNYPHVAAAHWTMYRLARYHDGLVTNHSWDWYLKNAYETSIAMTRVAPYYAQFGQMEGTVFLLILKDLKTEGYTEMANNLEAKMKERADHWKSLNYPFGSEMPWDSTGQEEVYMWSDYFGYNDKAKVTLDAILAYMPTMPHWAYNGNARRYWDFLYGGKLSRVERQIHHYGSALNAIPVLEQFKKTPEDFHLLKVGYGGLLGGISNITEDGFGPSAFHSYPETLRIDYLSGDYGSGFFGYAVNTATFITNEKEYGWLAFGGNVNEKGDEIEVEITTAAKSKVFVAPKKLWLTLDAGTFNKVTYNTKTGAVTITLDPKTTYTPNAYLRVDQDVKLSYEKVRGAYKIALKNKAIQIKL